MNGWYEWSNPAPINAPFSFAIMFHGNAGGQPFQLIMGNAYTSKIATRRKDLGVWDDWNYAAMVSIIPHT